MKRQMNGHAMLKQNVTVGEPDLKTSLGAKLSLVAEIPKSWSTALESARKAALFVTPKMFAAALATPRMPCTASDVMRWEAARALPSIAQIQRIRDLLPALAACDELLPLQLRGVAKVTPKPQAPTEGWTGPPVQTFQQALKFARMQAGMNQADVARLIGVVTSTYGHYEKASDQNMIRETWNRIVGVLPQMEFAPKPVFSAKYKNAFKAKGFLESEAARVDEHRAEASWIAKAEHRQPTARAVIIRSGEVDISRLVMAGAAFGALQAERRGLLAQVAKQKSDHEKELEALAQTQARATRELESKLTEVDRRIVEAAERMDHEANAAHGVTP